MSEQIQKIHNYPLDVNENEYANSGWFKYENQEANQTSGPNAASIRISKSDIPLEGILSYDNTLDPSRAFKGVVGRDDNGIKYVTFSTETGVNGQDGEDVNLNIEVSNLNDDTPIEYGNFFQSIEKEDVKVTL